MLPSHKPKFLPDQFNDPDKINRVFLNLPGECVVAMSRLTYNEFHRYKPNFHFELKPVNQSTILTILNNIKSSGIGIDKINIDIITLTLPNTLEIITEIVNTSIAINTFHSMWKHYAVRPIPK